jgi:hypothetical protein
MAMLSLLGGCVAALAVPAMTAVGVFTQKKRTRQQVVASLPAANTGAMAAVPGAPVSASSVRLTGLTELPPPSGNFPSAGAPWQTFATYALGRAAGLEKGGPAASALLTRESVTTFRAETRPCSRREPAVVIDLDPRDAVFGPDAARPVSPEIAAAVAQLRDAGLIVLWVSQASANEVAGVAAALEASGLDPTGRDPILLVRNPDERKQVLREEANETVCVVAMAGDERSDFDELFDYLRDRRLESAYDAQLGAGWFLVPPLFEAGEPVSAVVPTGEDGGR